MCSFMTVTLLLDFQGQISKLLYISITLLLYISQPNDAIDTK